MIDISFEKKLVIDSKRNLWVFYPTSSYRTAYILRRYKGEAEVAQLDMKGFTREIDIIVDERDNIHIVALSSEQKVVYIRYDTKKWITNTLYSFAGKSIEIYGLKIVKERSNLHLLYVYSERGGGCALFHHHWTGNEWRGYKVFDVPVQTGKICYDADAAQSNRLCVVAALQKSLRLWEFDGSQWRQKNNERKDEWENIEHITFQEDYVLIKNYRGVFFLNEAQSLDRAQAGEIVAAEHVENGPVIISRKNTLYAAWIEGGSLGYRTSYDGGSSWGRVKYYHHAQGEKLEVYGFSNTYSLLVKAKRIIATQPPELHIPFLHRSTERIKLPEDAFVETEKNPYDSSGESGHAPGVSQSGGEYPDGPGTPADSKDNEPPCRIPDETAVQVERIGSALRVLEYKIEEDVLKRLEKMAAELAQLKERIESTAGNTAGNNGTPELPGGNIITQNMINRRSKKG